MRQVIRLLFILWSVMIGAIVLIATIPIGHSCLKPVSVRHENAVGSGGLIMDYRKNAVKPLALAMGI